MRDATTEEQKGINAYVNSISYNTGINFFNYLEREKEMKTYIVEGYFTGEIEANSEEEANSKFDEFCIDSIDITSIEEINEED
jgi:hypothetical protein